MIKHLTITLLTVFTTGIALSQSNINSKIIQAEIAYFDKNDFSAALPLYKEVEKLAIPGHVAFTYSKEKVASCMYFLLQASQKNNSANYLQLAEDFVTYMAQNQTYIKDKAILDKRFLVMQKLIVKYNQHEQPMLARAHQEQMYLSYYMKQLPVEIRNSYQMDEFECMGKLVRVYESFDQVHNKTENTAFDKHVFEVFDVNDPEGHMEFSLQTERLMSSVRGARIDFVLTKREGEGVHETSQPYWQHTFKAPEDYRDVRQAVLSVLMEMPMLTEDQFATAE